MNIKTAMAILLSLLTHSNIYRIPGHGIKQTVIKPHQLADWYKAVIILVETDNYRNVLMWHDYFLLLLFTDMRKMEAASLRWEDVDLKSKTITLQDTKNHEIHTLPMSDRSSAQSHQ